MSEASQLDQGDRRSRRTMRDLVALSTLPAVWVGQGPNAIARSLGDVLFNTLSLDLLYLRLADSGETDSSEVIRARRPLSAAEEAALKISLAPLVNSYAGEVTSQIADPSGTRELHVAVTHFGVAGDHGVLVACSRRPDFPAEQDRLILGISANQAAVAMQRRRVDSELHEQREWLEVTLASIADAVIAVSTVGSVTFVNRAAETLTGWEAAEAKGKPLQTVLTLVDESTRQPVEIAVNEFSRGGAIPPGTEAVLIDQRGAERLIDVASGPIRNAAGKVIGRIITFRDITERKQADRALADARARLDAALEAGAIVTWTWDIPNNTLSSETMLARLFNLPASEARGGLLEKYTASIHPEDLPRVMATLNRAVEHDEVYEADYRIMKPDGSVRWVAARGRVQRDEAGRPLRMPGVLVDITERKRLEEELRLRVSQLAEADRSKEELVASLRESEEKLRLLADTIPQLAWMARRDGSIFWYNRRWYEYTGTTPAEMEGWGWQSVHHPETLPSVLERWKRSIDTGEPFDMVFPLKGADGSFRPFLTRVNALRASDGGILYWFGTNTDISEIKRMEEALREADRRKDEFLATLAHELRNPLAPIRNSLEILKMPRVDGTALQQARETMERQVQALVRLVDDLLDVARVMRGKVQLRKEPVELAAIVARAVETVQPLVDVQRHRLELDLPDESLLIDGDPLRLAQVIGNLLTNAAKYTEPNGRISVCARRDGPEAVIRIRDNGIGIAPHILPHVFELFVQADHSFTKAQGGLGIGLTLVKNLAQLHGGSVEARSEGLGKGAEFILRLPVMAQQAAREGQSHGEQAYQPMSSGHRLLIVDDNEDAASTLATLFSLQGHEVRVAHDGRSALNLAASFLPNLVFLDLGMPDIDGYEVARRLRVLPHLEAVTLVALTGWGQEEHRRRTAAAGFDHHLVKPLDPDAVAHLLHRVEHTTPRPDGQTRSLRH